MEELAVFQEDGMGTDTAGEGEVVGRDDFEDGQRIQTVAQLATGTGIEHGVGLIKEDGLGTHGEDPGQSDPTLFAAGKTGRVAVRQVRNGKLREGFVGAGGDFRFREAQIAGAECDVLANGLRHELIVGILENQPDAAADGGEIAALDGDAIHEDASAPDGDEPENALEEGGFTGAIAAEQGNGGRLRGVDREREIAHGPDSAGTLQHKMIEFDFHGQKRNKQSPRNRMNTPVHSRAVPASPVGSGASAR